MLLAEICTPRIIDKDHARVGHWLQAQGACQYNSAAVCIGLERNGELVAGVQYEQYSGVGGSMLVSIAVTGRPTKTFMRYICDYAAYEAKVNMVYAMVGEGNTKSQRLVEQMGFVRLCAVPQSHPTGATYLYGLWKSGCKYLTRRLQHG